MKKFTLVIIILAALVTIYIGFDTAEKPLTAGVFGFVGWALFPYALLIILNQKAIGKASASGVMILSVITAVFGLWTFVHISYVSNDAQSGLAWPVVPLWQLIFVAIATVPLYFLNRKKGA